MSLPTLGGVGSNGVCIVAPTRQEAESFMLDRVLRRASLTKEAFAIHVGVDGLLTYLQSHKNIKVVIGLGEDVLLRLLGESELMRWRGRPIWLKSYNVWFISTLAPTELLARKKEKWEKKKPLVNPPRFTRVVIGDFVRATIIAESGYQRSEQRDYLYDPEPERFRQWIDCYYGELKRNPDTYLSWDIETPYKLKQKNEEELEEALFDSTIIRISFSYRPYTAVTVPWDGPHLPGIKRLLASSGRMVVWNGSTFDVPVVRAAGVSVGGEAFDFMDGWHLLQSDLPKGLEFVTSFYTDLMPWKHLSGGDPQLYSCIDADAALRNALGIESDLRASGQWNLFMRHAVRLMPILYDAGRHGNLIDEPARQALEKELEQEEAKVIEEVQKVVPLKLRPTKRYKKLPKDAGENRSFLSVIVPGKIKVCSHCQMEVTSKTEHFKGKKNPCKAAKAEIQKVNGTVQEWDEVLPFNPNSSDQLINYMKHFEHPVGKPKDSDDEEAESADSKHLKKLVKEYGDKHPLYGLTLKAHLINKAIGTYVRGLKPDDQGLVHSTYVNSPSTWRLGSRDVNMQNQGKRAGNPYAKRARRLIIARPGHTLVQADSSSIEAVMVGYEMNDPDYIALAKRSIHAWLCCKKLGWEFTDENVDIIKSQHKVLYDQLKVTNHMTNYGGTPWTLVETFPDIFPTLRSAKEAQGFIFDALPQLKEWHHELRVRAQKESFLTSAWGHRHYFYDVFSKKPDGSVRYGKDSKRCIAFKPQNGAGAFMRDSLLIMGTHWSEAKKNPEFYPTVRLDQFEYLYSGKWREFMPANISVHDGYTLDVPNHLVDEAVDYLAALLTRPIPEMGGLQIGCEIEVGPNWLDMKGVRVVKV